MNGPGALHTRTVYGRLRVEHRLGLRLGAMALNLVCLMTLIHEGRVVLFPTVWTWTSSTRRVSERLANKYDCRCACLLLWLL